MSNKSYLSVTPPKTIYPSVTLPGYNTEEATIAYDVYCVPLLWLALFRPPDLRTTRLTDDEGHPFKAIAPISRVSAALAQLGAALPALNRLFAKEGPLDGYVGVFARAFDGLGKMWVTVELDEIACLYQEGEFDHVLTTGLAAFDRPRRRAADREALVRLAQLRPGGQFPDPLVFLGEAKVSADDCWNHSRLLGVSLYRETPW